MTTPLVPFDAIVFDCDGTLSQIEGIDELARMNGVGEKVSALTEKAMGKTGLTPALYRERLIATKPTLEQIHALGKMYFEHRTPDTEHVIQTFQRLGKAVYVISAGILAAVESFATALGVSEKNVFAVPVFFDRQHQYLDFDHESPLADRYGKRVILEEIKKTHPRIAFIGDGMNDYVARDVVERFIGYGGAFYRENIEKMCEFYVKDISMKSILPLCLTKKELGRAH